MKINVYYLDDEKDLCTNFEDEFSSENIIITTFSNAEYAIETANNNPPDIMFFDFRLQSITGDKVAEFITPDFPKYLITGELFVETSFKFKEVIGKPIKREYIHSLLDKLLAEKNIL